VLPLLNNLLENREMALEDGRFLGAYCSLVLKFERTPSTNERVWDVISES